MHLYYTKGVRRRVCRLPLAAVRGCIVPYVSRASLHDNGSPEACPKVTGTVRGA